MREILNHQITEAVKKLCLEANTSLSDDVLEALNKALANEKSGTGRKILNELIQNAKIAKENQMAICQDTGFAIVFVELGHDVIIKGRDLKAAVNEGVA